MGLGGWIILLLLLIAAGIGLLMALTRRTAREAEALVPRTGRLTPVKGGVIHWEAEGDGPPILLVHGLGGHWRNWTYAVTGPLAERGFRAIAIDRPGCGWSERDSDDLAELSEQARMIVEFMETEGIEKPLLVGHSLGGALSLTLAVLHPDKISGLALVAPLTHAMTEIPAGFRPLALRSAAMRRAIGATVAVPMAKRTAQQTLDFVFGPEPAPADFVTRGGGALGLRPKGFVCASADLVMGGAQLDRYDARWEEIQVPGGVLYGDADQVLDPKTQGEALIARLPHFEWRLMAGRGHMLPITAPQETVDFIAAMAEKAGLRANA